MNDKDSVCVYGLVSMKLQGISIVLLFGVTGFAEVSGGLCWVRNTDEPKVYCYQCYETNNYLADIEAAPVDIPRISFTYADIRIIRNGSFSRLSSGLQQLGIYASEIGDIEDNAFEGLAELSSLEVVKSNLQIVKGAWFKGLSKLKRISFEQNEIKRIESTFFSIVPPLKSLDISSNELNCLPVDSFGSFHAEELHLEDNPFSFMCLASLLDWLRDEDISPEFDGKTGMSEPLEPLINMCVKKLPKASLDEVSLDKCISETVASFLPPEGNYTSDQVCQFLNGRPSLLLTCPSQ